MDRWTFAAATLTMSLLVATTSFAATAVSTGSVADAAPLLDPARPPNALVRHAVRGAQPASGSGGVPAAAPDQKVLGTGTTPDLSAGTTPDLLAGTGAPAAAPGTAATTGSPSRVNPWLAPTLALPDPPASPTLSEGDRAPEVGVLKRRLVELGYRPSAGEALDNSFDEQTWSAVLAFQKAENLPRSGDADQATWARLAHPQAWSVTPATLYPRVEVDIERQIVLVVLGPQDVRTLNTSTGGGYTYRNEHGGLEVAETPIGDYRVYSAYDGWVKAPLGTLYRPLYFEGGYAIHGSPYVPSYPDSHGCVRLSNSDMDWLFDLAPLQMAVGVYDTMNPTKIFGLTPPAALAGPAIPDVAN